jgi:c(7)-type cytochrome triheme protein
MNNKFIEEAGMKIMGAFYLFLILAEPISAMARTTAGGGDLIFTPNGAGKVLFSHELHVKVKGLKCTRCHYHVFQMSKESYKMNMAKITKGAFCGKCHNGQKSFDVSDPKNCTKCHK